MARPSFFGGGAYPRAVYEFLRFDDYPLGRQGADWLRLCARRLWNGGNANGCGGFVGRCLCKSSDGKQDGDGGDGDLDWDVHPGFMVLPARQKSTSAADEHR